MNRELIAGTLKEINNEYARNLRKLKKNQTKELTLMKARHSEESKKLAKDITSGKTNDLHQICLQASQGFCLKLFPCFLGFIWLP